MESKIEIFTEARKVLTLVQKELRKNQFASTPPGLFMPSLLNKVSYLKVSLGRLLALEKRRQRNRKGKVR